MLYSTSYIVFTVSQSVFTGLTDWHNNMYLTLQCMLSSRITHHLISFGCIYFSLVFDILCPDKQHAIKVGEYIEKNNSSQKLQNKRKGQK